MTLPDASTVEKHAIVRQAGGFLPTPQAGLIEVRGRDRLEWLHNLVTNTVRNLGTGDGNYAFATNAQGRVLFDLNLLVLDEAAWLDIDRRWIDAAYTHLDKYHVTEDVALENVSNSWVRYGVLGPATARVVESLGLGANFAALADIQSVGGKANGIDIRLFKDRVGPISLANFIVPASESNRFAELLASQAETASMTSIDQALFDMIRIEAGRPASVDDIDDQVIPPETLQIERGISYVKGCYIGQEVIERMRSRGVMARRLTGFSVQGDRMPPHNAPVFGNGKEIGRITSSCYSVSLNGILGLGYLKTLLAESASTIEVALDENTRAAIEPIDLPLPAWR